MGIALAGRDADPGEDALDPDPTLDKQSGSRFDLTSTQKNSALTFSFFSRKDNTNDFEYLNAHTISGLDFLKSGSDSFLDPVPHRCRQGGNRNGRLLGERKEALQNNPYFSGVMTRLEYFFFCSNKNPTFLNLETK